VDGADPSRCLAGPPGIFPRTETRVKLAREIAARTKLWFIKIKPESRTKLRRTNEWLEVHIQTRAC
jgi:hypothetical protein